jgi:hypothetical protein
MELLLEQNFDQRPGMLPKRICTLTALFGRLTFRTRSVTSVTATFAPDTYDQLHERES